MESFTETEPHQAAIQPLRTETGPKRDSSESQSELQLVATDLGYSKPQFIEPSTRGYIHIGAAVQPRSLPFTLLPTGRKKAEFIGRLKAHAQQLERIDAVENATIFEAVGMPPLHRLPYIKERTESIHLARFDVAVLIETSSPAAARDVQETPAYQALMDAVQTDASDTHVMTARNEKRIGDVEKTSGGLFVFNHFVADDPDVLLELFDYLAGWYTAETGLDNSTLLVPVDDEDSDYVAVNNARWEMGLGRFLWKQLSKKSFREYVLANLNANRAGAMPVLYRLA